MKRFAFLFSFFAMLVSISWAVVAQIPAVSVPHNRTQVVFYTLKGEVAFSLEMATNPKEREIGLMNRNGLESSDGMIFVFPKPIETAFWMKDTRIALDMIFIDSSYTIVRIVHNARPHTLNPRASGAPIIAAVELAGGKAKEKGLKRGDRVRIALPSHKEVY
jgi:uncharacterized membrane protein (UPF0127 family)